MVSIVSGQSSKYLDQNVVLISNDGNICEISCEDIWHAGKAAAQQAAEGRTISDKTYFSAEYVDQEGSVFTFLDKASLAAAYNAVLNTKFPITEYGRNPAAPPELVAA